MGMSVVRVDLQSVCNAISGPIQKLPLSGVTQRFSRLKKKIRARFWCIGALLVRIPASKVLRDDIGTNAIEPKHLPEDSCG
jgi:hypothetical protein